MSYIILPPLLICPLFVKFVPLNVYAANTPLPSPAYMYVPSPHTLFMFSPSSICPAIVKFVPLNVYALSPSS